MPNIKIAGLSWADLGKLKKLAKHAQAIRAALGVKLDLDLDAAVIVKSAALALLGKLGRAATTRNWSTVQKLQALLLAMQKA